MTIPDKLAAATATTTITGTSIGLGVYFSQDSEVTGEATGNSEQNEEQKSKLTRSFAFKRTMTGPKEEPKLNFDLPEEKTKTAPPTAKTIEDVGTTYSSSFIGSIYKSKLIDAKDEGNKDWWEWSYKNRLEKSNLYKHDDFSNSNVKKGWSKIEDDEEALNKVCEEKYGKSEEENEYLWKDITLFCFKDLDKFKETTDKNTYEAEFVSTDGTTTSIIYKIIDDNFGQLEEDLGILFVDPWSKKNTNWWNWAYKNRFESNKNRFTELTSSINKGFAETGTGSLNKFCENALFSQKPLTEDFWLLCSVSGEKPDELKSQKTI